jgi:hypothetical protein
MLEHSKTTKEIDEAFFRIMQKAPAIKKKSANDYYKSKYAEYPDIQEILKPLFIEEKLLVKFFPVEGNKLILIITHLTSQEFFKSVMDLNSVSATPQAQGSAISYMKRYSIAAAFDLIIEGDDDDGNASSGKQKEQQPGANTNQQGNSQAPAPPANLKWLNPNTKDWFNAKWMIFNNGKTLEDIRKKFKVSEAKSIILIKPEDLKPGTAYWGFATEYLAKEDSKIGKITTMFSLSETDQQDLQIDATNYTPATDDNTK